MINVEELIKNYEVLYEQEKQGIVNGVPLKPFLPAFSRYLPAIQKGNQFLVTANSGVGKTQITKFLFAIVPYLYSKINPNYKYKVLWFALEESKQEFFDSIMLYFTEQKYQKRLNMHILQNVDESCKLNPDIIQMLESNKQEMEDFFTNVEIIDTISNPYGIYKHCRAYSEKIGKHHYVTKEFEKTNKDGSKVLDVTGSPVTEQVEVYSHYENTSNEHVIVVVDHISLLSQEKQFKSWYETIEHYSTEYCRKQMSKHWGFTVVNVQQQASDKEKQQYTVKGESIEDKLEPSLDGLGDIKITQRDCHVVLGLFAPDRYGIKSHKDYNTEFLGDNYRSISILKNRYGSANVKKGLLFDGATLRFEELPPAKEFTGFDAKHDYQDILKKFLNQ